MPSIKEGTMLSYLSFKGEDWGCMTQLFFDNISILLGVLAVLFNMTSFGVPIDVINEVVYKKIIPGMGLALVFGNTYYTYLGMRRSKEEGRAFTAQPYGINSPGAFAFAFNIMYPVYFAGPGDPTENFLLAYNVAVAANFISGLVSVVLGAVGSRVLAIIPPEALLVPLAGVGFAFLGLEQAAAPFGAPLVGFSTITFLFLGWHANIRLSWGNIRVPEAVQIILVGVTLGWITGLNKSSDVTDAAKLVKWYGPTWAGNDMIKNFSYTKDYLGIIFPIAISAVGNSLMSLVSAKTAGDPYPITESMIVDGIGTIVSSLFGSPFGTVMYIGHPAYKKSGATTGYSVINGILYMFLSWFGLFALIRSIVNQATVGPIVLFVGLALLEECFRCLPSRHYAAMAFGLFPSVCDWVTNIADRSPLTEFAEDGTAYNSNLPDLTEGWWGILGCKRGAILVSLCWVTILVHVIDRKWWQAAVWALISATLSAFGLIHVPVAGFKTFHDAVSDNCSPVTDNNDIVVSTTCWEHGNQWQYMTAYLMIGMIFITIETLRRAGIGNLDAPIECSTADAFRDWYGKDKNVAERVEEENKETEFTQAATDPSFP
ncbi:unnamed protein product [Ascophyllum nodosum]